VAAVLTWTSGLALAGPNQGSWNVLVAAAATSQSGEARASASDPRAQVADLLARARRAMKDGNFETAESLIDKADALNVKFPRVYVGDTPAKARGDLERHKGRAGKGKRPSQLYPPRGDAVDDNAGLPRDPFAGRTGPASGPLPRRSTDAPESTPPGEFEPMPGLTGNQSFPDRSPFGRQAMTTPPGDANDELRIGGGSLDEDARAESDRLLLAARRALSVGDVRHATGLVKQAKGLGLSYEFNEDSPDKLEALVSQAAQLAARGSDRQSESYRKQQAELLMREAEGLLQWQDFDEAERLAIDAEKLDVAYGPYDLKPSAVVQRIAAARKQGGSARLEGLPQVLPGDARRVADAAELPLDEATLRLKTEASALVRQAREALAAGDLRQAEVLAEQAENLHVPSNAYGKNEDKPWLVLYKINQLRKGQGDVIAASAEEPIGAQDDGGGRYAASQALYDRDNDRTENVPASRQEQAVMPDSAMMMYAKGLEALKKGDKPSALKWFREANARRDELDSTTQRELQDKLQLLSHDSGPSRRPGGREAGSLLSETDAAQQLRYRQASSALTRQEASANKIKESNPKQALKVLQEARADVTRAGLDGTTRDMLLRRVDRNIGELQHYIDDNSARIDLNEKNDAVRADIDHRRQVKIEVQEKLAKMVNEFNNLMDEKRFPEAEVVAKRAAEMAPDELVVMQLQKQVKMVKRTAEVASVRDAKEEGFYRQLQNVEESGIPFDDNKAIVFPDAKKWSAISMSPARQRREGRKQRSEKEIEIEQKLKTPVSLGFHEAPLAQVIDRLQQLTQVPIVLDPRGLAEEGVDSSTPVTIDLNSEISLKSALNLILAPLQLSYVIKNEVLNITSEQLRDGVVYPVTYNVADLVIPIPNFLPNSRMGLAGPLAEAYAQVPMYAGGTGAEPPLIAATPTGAGANMMLDPSLMAQISQANSQASIVPRPNQPASYGPGGLGGGAQPDFESLIELITSTIAPTTWAEVGGPGSIQEFKGNLSLVISQTQEVHEEIADLLDQLRRLQDLQVTIEVRFITLNDNFFERIGVSFDLNIPTYPDKKFQIFGEKQSDAPILNQTAFPPPGQPRDLQPYDLTTHEGVTVGLGTATAYSASLDIPVQQNSFTNAIPQFGGYQNAAGAQLGFAILSKLEAFFFIEASQGDQRSNVMQAPKVTMFNGQSAIVNDTTSVPFVVSVIPVVGAFAAAQMPVIMVLNQGTALTVQAVVSSDRRFVRLTLVPFFSTITAVNTFTFTGSSSSSTETSSEGPSDMTTKRSSASSAANEGTTVQLPSFAVFTVATTVSVPDGGTVLLGGVKRLAEGRNEFGVPLLSKIPYVNRLFRNQATGRETQSLMMMVTPRIIIQEEEEELLGITPTP
jgi:general secretion pathway protein D